MSNKENLLGRELESLKRQGKVYNVLLSDLVMMQMVGDFDSFVQTLTKKSEEEKDAFSLADQMIKDTKEHATTAKLFESIVEKTIEAQFGDKHAALRELGQNGIDAYDCSDIKKPVVFDVSKSEEYLVLRSRDYGCGMDLKSLVKDLLVPYNSGKEFDPTKIGEHGIGWYSIVDLAELVKVVTKFKDSDKTIQSLIYNKDGKWMSSILLESDKGFSEDLNKEPHGTEVIAYVPENMTSEGGVRDFLFQHLGMVDKDYAQIILGKELINSVRDEYNLSVPVQVKVEGKEMHLTMGASKRKLKYSGNDDTRFKHRDLNLEKILYTQKGLFIKYDFIPFDDETVHRKLMSDLAFMGLDFWADVPEHVTLTKGRNNIIANHSIQILDGMYQAFENLFLDVLLCDEELLYHPSRVLLESISNLFNKSYSDAAELFEKRKYSLKRRLASTGAAIGSKSVDIGVLVARTFGKYAYRIAKYPFTSMPEDLKKMGSDFKRALPDIGRWTLNKSIKYGLPTAAMAGLTYGGIKLYEAYGFEPFKYVIGGLTVLGGYLFIKNWPRIKKWYDNFSSSKGDISLGELLSDTYKWSKDAFMFLLNKMGLYVDMEKKRELKREKQRKKISEKYLSKMRADEFFKKVLHKKIIPSEFYASENSSQQKVKKPSDVSLGEMFKDFLSGNNPLYFDTLKEGFKEFKYSRLNKSNVHLSIDDIIDLYMKGSLKYSKSLKNDLSFRDGDYFVDYNNPIIHTVVDKLEQITYHIKTKYDVKILEDHLDNLVSFAKESCMAMYIMSPIGMLHLAVIMLKNSKNPFKDYYFYNKSSLVANLVVDSLKDYKVWLPVVTGVAKGCVRIPYSLAYNIGKEAYDNLIVPSCKAVNPVKYPNYVKSIIRWGSKKIEERKKKKEMRAQADKAMREAEPSLSKKNWFSTLKEYLSDYYQNSIINELFGYGVLGGESFTGLSKKRLEHTTRLVGVGEVYPDLMSMVENLDELVSKALDKKPFYVIMSYDPSRDPSYNHNGFMLPDKKRTLHVCLEKIDSLVCSTVCSYNFNADKENKLAKLGYTVLDALVHQRTHEELKCYKHNRKTYDNSFHDREFFDKKDELRRKVVDYLEKNEIKLTSYAENFFQKRWDKKPSYYTTPKYLSKLVHMTRRRLRDEVLTHSIETYKEGLKKDTSS